MQVAHRLVLLFLKVSDMLLTCCQFILQDVVRHQKNSNELIDRDLALVILVHLFVQLLQNPFVKVALLLKNIK
jgi:hypothetical protein